MTLSVIFWGWTCSGWRSYRGRRGELGEGKGCWRSGGVPRILKTPPIPSILGHSSGLGLSPSGLPSLRAALRQPWDWEWNPSLQNQ